MEIELTYETADGHTRNVAGSLGATAPLGVALNTENEELKILNDGTLTSAWKGGRVLGEVVDVEEWEEPPEEYSGWYMEEQR